MDPDLNLNGFLKFGFFPNYTEKPSFDISCARPGAHGSTPDDELFSQLDQALHQAVSDLVADGLPPLMLISGGLDSRLIFAILLEHFEAREIQTCTFGTPGSWDFDIGVDLAKKAGCPHEAFDLTQHEYTEQELIQISSMFRRQTVMFHQFPLIEFAQRFSGMAIWSGFLAGEVAKGCDQPSDDIEAFRGFFKKNTYSRTESVCRLDDQAIARSLIIPDEVRTLLQLEDELNFRHRQAKFIEPHVLPLGFEHRTVFAHPAVVSFFLRLSHSQRRKADFYRRFLVDRYESWFATPTKNHYGLPLNAPKAHVESRRVVRGVRRRARRFGLSYTDRMTNYLDFSKELRDEGSAYQLIRGSVEDLKARGIVDWADGPDLLRRHRLGQTEGAEALLLLASLEIHLKNGKVL